MDECRSLSCCSNAHTPLCDCSRSSASRSNRKRMHTASRPKPKRAQWLRSDRRARSRCRVTCVGVNWVVMVMLATEVISYTQCVISVWRERNVFRCYTGGMSKFWMQETKLARCFWLVHPWEKKHWMSIIVNINRVDNPNLEAFCDYIWPAISPFDPWRR